MHTLFPAMPTMILMQSTMEAEERTAISRSILDPGEDAADLGPGSADGDNRTCVERTGHKRRLERECVHRRCALAVDSTPPDRCVRNTSTDYGITYTDINKGQNQTFYWAFTAERPAAMRFGLYPRLCTPVILV